MKTQKQIIDEAFKLGIEFQSVTNEERAKNKTEIDILHKLTDLEDEDTIVKDHAAIVKDHETRKNQFLKLVNYAFSRDVELINTASTVTRSVGNSEVETCIRLKYLERFVCYKCKMVYRTKNEVNKCCAGWVSNG